MKTLLSVPAEDIKIFEYDPRAGKRGGQMGVGTCEWVGMNTHSAMREGRVHPLDWNYPREVEPDEAWFCCVDAGWGSGTSIRHSEEWTCFCVGWDQMLGIWKWVILPPTSAIKTIGGDK